MKIELTLYDDGMIIASVAEGDFAQARAALELIKTLASDLPIEFGQVERHRHEHTPKLEVRS